MDQSHFDFALPPNYHGSDFIISICPRKHLHVHNGFETVAITNDQTTAIAMMREANMCQAMTLIWPPESGFYLFKIKVHEKFHLDDRINGAQDAWKN